MTSVSFVRCLAAAAVLLVSFGGRARADCGDGTLDAGEICDDGNRFGGDGCAENCTHETVRTFRIDPERSYAITQLKLFSIPIQIGGTLKFTIGGPGESGIMPVTIRANDVEFGPIPVPGVACVCIRSEVRAADFGPGNVARGTLDCGAEGDTALSDFLFTQDHNTADEDPNCISGTLEGPQDPHPGGCIGGKRFSYSFNGPRGSMALADNISFTQIADGGTCSTDPNSPAKGVDGIPCNDDDPDPTPGTNVPATTGLAQAAVFDADNIPGNEIALGQNCGNVPCQVELSGDPFDCNAIAADPNGGLDTGALALAFQILHNVGFGDSVVTVLIAPSPPQPPCTGDCNGDGRVTINELIIGVRIAVGDAEGTDCASMDADASDRVEINELIQGVRNALDGCPVN